MQTLTLRTAAAGLILTAGFGFPHLAVAQDIPPADPMENAAPAPSTTPPATDSTMPSEPATPTPAEPTATAPTLPAPTLDTNEDGTPDAWDQNGDGAADVWDMDGDGQPDALDSDGDGTPDRYRDGYKPTTAEEPGEPR